MHWPGAATEVSSGAFSSGGEEGRLVVAGPVLPVTACVVGAAAVPSTSVTHAVTVTATSSVAPASANPCLDIEKTLPSEA